MLSGSEPDVLRPAPHLRPRRQSLPRTRRRAEHTHPPRTRRVVHRQQRQAHGRHGPGHGRHRDVVHPSVCVHRVSTTLGSGSERGDGRRGGPAHLDRSVRGRDGDDEPAGALGDGAGRLVLPHFIAAAYIVVGAEY